MTCGWNPCRIGWLALLFVVGTSSSWGAQTATVTTSDPVAFVKGSSHVKRPVQPDEVFNVVSISGD